MEASNLAVKSTVSFPMQASKWLKCPLLIDEKEMRALLNDLGAFEIFLVSGLIPRGKGYVEQEDFLDCYANYVQALKKSEMPVDKRLGPFFSSVFTCAADCLYAVPIDEYRQLIKVQKPVIQLQMHRFSLGADKKLRSMVFGPDSIHWGIQFSYPQLYQNEKMEVFKTNDSEMFPNAALFKLLQKWVRDNTLATPFLIDNERVNVPIRLGKACFEWINHHPQLSLAGLQVSSTSTRLH